MRPNRSSGISSAISGGNPSATRAFQSAFESRSRMNAAQRAVRNGRFAESGVPEHVIRIRMRREAHLTGWPTREVAAMKALIAGTPGP